MEELIELSGRTPTELLKISNDITAKHSALKQEIIDLSYECDELEKKINQKLALLDMLEKSYVSVIEEINRR